MSVHESLAIVARVVISLLTVKFINCSHLVFSKIEIKQVNVLQKSSGVGGLRDNSGLALDTPLEADLCSSLVVGCSNSLNSISLGQNIIL